MYQIKITTKKDGVEEIEKINDISFIGEIMIICLINLKTRLVRPLSNIESYELKETPIVNPKKKKSK